MLSLKAIAAVALAASGAASASDLPPSPDPSSTTADAELPVIRLADSTPEPAVEWEAPGEERSEIPEVIVTAQKRSESALKVPLSITAFNGEALTERGVMDVRDLQKIVPGFSAAESGYNTPIFTLRGVGYNDSTYFATSTVGVYLDEFNLPYSIMAKGPLLDVQRIEVLKGPQGTLYGRNTTGGLINYVANKPTEVFEAGVTAGYSSYSNYDLEGFVSGPLTDTLSGRLAVRELYADEGWQVSNTRADDRLGQKDKTALRGQLEWQPGDNVSFRLLLDGWRDRSEPQAPQPTALRVQNPLVPSTPEFLQQLLQVLPSSVISLPIVESLATGNVILAPEVADYPFLGIGYDNPRTADWAPGTDWRLHDQFYHLGLRSEWQVSDAAKLTTLINHLDVESDGSRVPMTGFDTLNVERELNASIRSSSIEVRLDYDADEIRWIGGFNASKDRAVEDDRTLQITTSGGFPIPLLGQGLGDSLGLYAKQNAEQIAGFVNADWELSDTLSLSGGLRYTHEKRDYEGCTYVPTGTNGPLGLPNLFPLVFTAVPVTTGGLGVVQPGTGHQLPGDLLGDCFANKSGVGPGLFIDEITDNNLSGRLALSWRVTDDWMTYASLARGFKSGGYPLLNSTSHDQYAASRPEELLAYEIGAKGTAMDRRLQLTSAIFYYDYKDKQLLSNFRDPLFGTMPVLKNAPKSHVYGGEIELQARPADSLKIGVAAAYIKTRIDEFSSIDINGEQADFRGRPFNFSPEWTATAIAEYAPGYLRGAYAGVSLTADYSYTGGTNSTLEGDPRFVHPSSGVWGARINLLPNNGGWSASIFGQNLTNELVTISNTTVGDSIARYTGLPRWFGASVSYRW